MGKLKDAKWMDIVLIENERYSVQELVCENRLTLPV